jgi:hypothetical protein
MDCAVPQHCVELGFGDGEAIQCQSPRLAGDRCSPDVMDHVMADFVLDSGWASEVQEFGEEAVYRCAVSDGLNTGDQCVGVLGWYGRRDSVQ